MDAALPVDFAASAAASPDAAMRAAAARVIARTRRDWVKPPVSVAGGARPTLELASRALANQPRTGD